MAIPIYVPEEAGPAPSSSSQAGTLTSAASAPFLHQLILELYSVYQDYCNTGSANASSVRLNRSAHMRGLSDVDPDRDHNNNHSARVPDANNNHISLRVNPSSRPLATSTCQQPELQQRQSPANSPNDSDESYKLAFEDDLSSIGRDLRLIADSFQSRSRCSKPAPSPHLSQSPDSEDWHWSLSLEMLILPSPRSWTIVFLISGSALAVGALRHVWKV